MKAVRTREESLHELQRRRRRTAASVENIKKKLARMNQETKAFGAQMEVLNTSCEDMRNLDAKIAHERSMIVVFKRKCTKNWLTLKFGGLAECCEKGMVCSARHSGRDFLIYIYTDCRGDREANGSRG